MPNLHALQPTQISSPRHDIKTTAKAIRASRQDNLRRFMFPMSLNVKLQATLYKIKVVSFETIICLGFVELHDGALVNALLFSRQPKRARS